MTDASTIDRIEGLDRESNLHRVYNASVRKKMTFITIMVIALVIAFILSVALGTVDIPFTDTVKAILYNIYPDPSLMPSESYYVKFIYARSGRSFLCILTGVSLAIAGTIMQGVLRNPLVSPFTLGVSSAASFGAAMGIVFWPFLFGSTVTSYTVLGSVMTDQDIFMVIMAFVFSLLSVFFVLLMARRTAMSRSTVILSGVIISYFFQAGVSFAKYISDDESLRDITNWLLGGMWKASMGVDFIVFPIVAICSIYLMYLSPKINVLAAGDDVAQSLGIDVNKLRDKVLIVSTLMSSVCLAFTGIIGFIGLMAPHICRMVIGNDTRFLVPASALMGSLILLVSDTVGRIIMRPEELPVGIIMYVLGGIFFVWMMLRKKKEVVM